MNNNRYREDRDHGPFHDYMGPERFVENDSSVVLCKSGQVGLALEMCGPDSSCVDEEDLASITERWRDAIRMFATEYEVRQYARKISDPPIPVGDYEHPETARLVRARRDQVASHGADLYMVEQFAMILLDCPLLKGSKNKPAILAEALYDGSSQLRRAVSSFIQHIKYDISLRILDKDGTFNCLRKLANFDKALLEPRRCPSDENIDYAICDSRLNLIWEDERHRDPYLLMENMYAKVMALKIMPKRTDVDMISRLFAIPGDCIFASRWRAEEVAKTEGVARFKKGKFWQTAKESSSDNKNAKVMYDESKLSNAEQLNALINDISQNGERFGHYSLYAVLFGNEERVHASAVEISKAFQIDDRDGTFALDHANQLGGFKAMLPGNNAPDRRKQRISLSNYAELSSIFSLDCGSVRNPHLNDEYWMVVETKPPRGLVGRTPYFFSPACNGVQHMGVFGPTGAGKTMFLKVKIANAQKYKPYTAILDLKRSFEKLTARFGGSTISFANKQFKGNPFLLPESEDNSQFLSLFVAVLIERGGGEMTTEDREGLYNYIRILYEQPRENRRLSVLQPMLRLDLQGSLAPWVEGGQYGWFFDSAEDMVTVADWQNFEFEGMDNYKEVLELLLFYVIHRIRQVVFDPEQAARLKLLILEEAWKLIKHPLIFAYVEEAARSFRDKNGCMVICSQNIGDLPAALIDCCPTKVFCGYSKADRELYETLGELNGAAVKELKGLQRHREFLLGTPDGSKVLQLNLSKEELLAYR